MDCIRRPVDCEDTYIIFLVVWVWTNMLLMEVVDILSVDDDKKIEELMTKLISTLMVTSVLNVYSMLNLKKLVR